MVNAFFSGNGLSRSRLWTWPCHAAKSGIAICVATFAHGVGLVYGLLFANCSGLSLLNFICTSFFFIALSYCLVFLYLSSRPGTGNSALFSGKRSFSLLQRCHACQRSRASLFFFYFLNSC